MIAEDLLPLARPVDEFQLYPDNPRQGDVGAISESLRRFGQQKPIVVQASTGYVVAGNHLLQAARHLGWERIAANVVELDDVTAKAFLVADNRTQELGSVDAVQLAELLRDLATADALDGVGYDGDDLDAMLQDLALDAARDSNDDHAPPVPPEPVSQPGELYELGPHRLVCGDASDPAVYELLLDGVLADLVWTDPPYGVDVVGGSRAVPKEQRRREGRPEIQNDALTGDGLEQLLRDTLGMAYAHARPGSNWYVAGPSGQQGVAFSTVLTELGLLRWELVWVKDRMVLSRADYHPRHERISYGWKPGEGRVRPRDRTLTSVLEVPRPAASEQHPTMKPVALIEIMVRASSRQGDLVLDVFGGSGSTMIAADRLGRRAALVELDPGYCDVIRTRYAAHVGDPSLAAIGEPAA